MYISPDLKSFIDEASKHDSYWVERTKVDFAVALEAQRRQSGLSYKRIAERMKASAAYISKVFRGDTNLTIESMVKLAHAAGGRLEVRVVGHEEAPFCWNHQRVRQQTLQRVDLPLRSEVGDTRADVATVTKVDWDAQHFFNRAA